MTNLSPLCLPFLRFFMISFQKMKKVSNHLSLWSAFPMILCKKYGSPHKIWTSPLRPKRRLSSPINSLSKNPFTSSEFLCLVLPCMVLHFAIGDFPFYGSGWLFSRPTTLALFGYARRGEGYAFLGVAHSFGVRVRKQLSQNN